MIQEAEEQVRVIRKKLKTAQYRQKSQYDHKHKLMTYEVGEKAYLRVTPLKVSDFGFWQTLEVRTLGCARRFRLLPTCTPPP